MKPFIQYWIEINCAVVNISLILGSCASFSSWSYVQLCPALMEPFLALGSAACFGLFYHDVLLCWGIGWMTRRLVGLFTPQKGHLSHFKPSNSLCLSLPGSVCFYLSLPPFNSLPPSLSLSRDADVQRRLRAWLLPELDCSAAESKAALNRPRAASALSEKCLKTKASRVLSVFGAEHVGG